MSLVREASAALPRRVEIAVVGAGPGGALAARELAGAGRDVLLLERAALPRYKTCGGGLVARARRRLGVGLEGAVERECRQVELAFGGTPYRVERAEPVVTMAMRATLDERIVDAALAAGARLAAECAVGGMRHGDGAVDLETASGTVRADFVVAADGAQSALARAAGWPANPHVVPALEAEVEVDPERCAHLFERARFDFDVPPGGYAWVFPKRAHLSVGLLRARRGRTDLKGGLERYLESVGATPVLGIERHGATIPLAPRPGGLARGRVLLVGDAAGLADPVTAEGIGPALESARMVARAIVEGGGDPARVAALYPRLARPLLAELRAGRLLARLLYRHPRLRGALFRRHGRALVEAMTDVVMGERSYRGLLASPRSYLRLFARG